MWSNRMSPLQHYSMLPGKSQSHLQEYLLLSENHLECLSLPLRINVCMRVISRSAGYFSRPHGHMAARSPPWRTDPIITTDLHLLSISASIETTIRNVKIHHQPNGLNESFPYRKSTQVSYFSPLVIPPNDHDH